MDQPNLFSDPVQPEPVRYEAPEPSADPFRTPAQAGEDSAAPAAANAAA
jgi:hypothetical protein